MISRTAVLPVESRVGTGIALTILAVVGFAALDACVKTIGTVMPLAIVVWFRYFFQASAMGTWLALRVGRPGFRAARPSFQVLRGSLLLSTSVLSYFALQYLPVAEFTAILMLAPVIVTMVSPLLLSEHVSRVRWLLVLVSFIGGITVVRPGSAVFGAAALLPLALAFVSAMFQIVTRRMASLESPLTTHFYSGVVGTLLMTPIVLWSARSVPALFAVATPTHWLLMVMVGVLGTSAHLAFIQGVSRAPMAVLMPFTYGQIAVAALLGVLVFSHTPDGWAVVGMTLIAASGAASVWVNMRQRARSNAVSVVEADTGLGD